jgi:hypothetical protein
MSITRSIAVSIAIFWGITPNIAAASTVSNVVKYCSSAIDSSDYLYCLGLMVGAEDLAIVATSNELIQQSQLDAFPLPNDPQTGKPFTDPRLAIIAIDKDLSRLSSNPYAHETIMALRDWRDRIGQSLKSSGAPSDGPPLGICFSHPPPGPGELADVFVAWAKANAGANNWDESLGLAAAFRARWPCGSISHP